MNICLAFTQLMRQPGRKIAAFFCVALEKMIFVSLQAYADGYREKARAPLISERFE